MQDWLGGGHLLWRGTCGKSYSVPSAQSQKESLRALRASDKPGRGKSLKESFWFRVGHCWYADRRLVWCLLASGGSKNLRWTSEEEEETCPSALENPKLLRTVFVKQQCNVNNWHPSSQSSMWSHRYLSNCKSVSGVIILGKKSGITWAHPLHTVLLFYLKRPCW